MQKQFEILNATRNNVLKAIEGLTLDQLNTIPTGFKNNIMLVLILIICILNMLNFTRL